MRSNIVEFIGAASKSRQRSAILARLRCGPVSTVEARDQLGIAHPAGRVLELRKLGHAIQTQRVRAFDAQGRLHAAALYVLSEEGVEHV